MIVVCFPKLAKPIGITELVQKVWILPPWIKCHLPFDSALWLCPRIPPNICSYKYINVYICAISLIHNNCSMYMHVPLRCYFDCSPILYHKLQDRCLCLSMPGSSHIICAHNENSSVFVTHSFKYSYSVW